MIDYDSGKPASRVQAEQLLTRIEGLSADLGELRRAVRRLEWAVCAVLTVLFGLVALTLLR
jgi:hypothetical protein